MKYTDEDLESAEAAFDRWGRFGPNAADLAQLIADVRREARQADDMDIDETAGMLAAEIEAHRKTRDERDEARRDAQSLARWLVELGETVDPDPEKP